MVMDGTGHMQLQQLKKIFCKISHVTSITQYSKSLNFMKSFNEIIMKICGIFLALSMDVTKVFTSWNCLSTKFAFRMERWTDIRDESFLMPSLNYC